MNQYVPTLLNIIEKYYRTVYVYTLCISTLLHTGYFIYTCTANNNYFLK